jgi:uncharacterized protein YndB with AHSA1/START domain
MKTAPLVIEKTVAASVSDVWAALTKPKHLKQWLPFFGDFKPKVGYVVRFKMGPSPKHQYEHVCEVTAVEPEHKLTYSWRYNGYPGNSYITYELAAKGKKTKLRLTHNITEPFPADNPDFAIQNFARGWKFTAEALKAFAEDLA